AGGLLVRSHGVSLPRGVPLVVAEEADGALLCNEVVTELDAGLAEQQKNVLIRIRPDGEADPAFCVPLGSDSPHVLPDGRVDPTFQTAELARVVPDAPNRRYALGGDLSLPHCGFGPTLIGIMKSSKQLGGWGVLGFLFMAGGARGFSNPEMNPFPANDWAERRKTAPGRKRFERD
ncbi:MAG: hypothetical protein RBT03_07495, partial [Kiritimatiellia bacterium]|nr:hypothetical protein [Kiritimatiellia bacterium]